MHCSIKEGEKSQQCLHLTKFIRKYETRPWKTHIVLEFNRCDTWFLVQETINPRKVWPTGNFTVRLDERWCDCGKLQKFHMPCSHVVIACKHAHHEYKSYIHLVYKLQSVSNVYK